MMHGFVKKFSPTICKLLYRKNYEIQALFSIQNFRSTPNQKNEIASFHALV